jgi:PAS domain S-box-containing protein
MAMAKLFLILNKSYARDLQSTLKSLGYQIAGCISDSQQALEKIELLKPDLVLISIHLSSGLEGIQVGKQIYDQCDLPVIYISDQSSQATIRRTRGTTPFGYLFHPSDEKQILATIEVALTRHSLEKKVRESERWLYTILHSISDGVIAVDMEERIRFINPVAEELTGKQYWNAIDQPIGEVLSLVYANTEERVTLSHALAFFQKQSLRTGFEAQLIHRDNRRIPVEMFISPLTNKGEQVGMVLAFRDISERKRSLEEIRRYAVRSQALLKAAEQLNARLDVKAVLQMVCEICNNTLNTTATSAFLHEPTKKIFKSTTIAVDDNEANIYKFKAGPFYSRFNFPASLVTNLISAAKPITVVDDIQEVDIPDIPYLDKIKELDVRSLAISGMYHNEGLAGIIVAQTNGATRDFTPEDLEVLRGLTDHAAIAVGNATLFEQVVASRERQQALTRRLVDVQEEERRNLARELHDQIGQMMTGLQFSLSALLPNASKEQKEKIADIQRLVSSLIAQTREISINLRPSMLDDTGLILTLIWHFNRYTSQTNIKVNFQHFNLLDKRFQTEVETTVFRIIQEALTNVARHAKAESVNIVLKLEGDVITIDIRDKGQGFDVYNVDPTSHVGLNSMRDRAYSVGGLMDIQTAPGRGTHIHVAIPLSGMVERRQHERHRSTR